MSKKAKNITKKSTTNVTTGKSNKTVNIKDEENLIMPKKEDKAIVVIDKGEVKSNVTLAIVPPKTNTAENWKKAAEDLAQQIGVHWTSKEIRAQVELNWPELKALPSARTDEVKSYIRKDSVGRAWLSRKRLFGPSGYKEGAHPKAGTGEPKETLNLTDEEKAARKADAVKRSWESRKKVYGDSGYKAGHSPLNNKKTGTESD